VNIRSVPGWLVGAVAVMAGLGYLTWHKFANDDSDEAWLDPGQPPAQVALPLVSAHGSASPMSCNTGFRSRCYPDVLATAEAVLKGAL
jgi:hypothetical protein